MEGKGGMVGAEDHVVRDAGGRGGCLLSTWRSSRRGGSGELRSQGHGGSISGGKHGQHVTCY